MTVASNTPYDQYSATAGQTIFNYTFEIVEQTDILVYQRGASDAPDDVADLLVLNVDYTVAGAGNENGGTITLAVGATLNDVVTLKQNVPVERDTSFTNGGVLRAQDLNNEFDQQMLTQQVSRFNEENRMLRYFDSAVLTDPKDLIIPVLSANQIWAMNNAGDEIIAYDVPADGGLAPKNATYLIQTANAELPNAQAMGALATGFVFNTITTGVQDTRVFQGTTNQLGVTNGNGAGGNPTYFIVDNPTLPGTGYFFPPQGTTAQRPGTPLDGMVRYNTTIRALEVFEFNQWDPLSGGVVDLVTGTLNQINVDNTDPANPILSLSSTLDFPGTFTVQGSTVIDGIIDDDTMATATDSNLSTSEATKAYIDNTLTGYVLSVTGTLNEIDIDNTDTQNPIFSLSPTLVLPGSMQFGGAVNADNNILNNLPFPTTASEAATKGYVDAIAFNTHPAANYSTTANLAGYTYDNGTAGVGATLTAGSNGAFATDGQSPAQNDRIFVPFQTNQAQNGIYTLTQVGDGSSPAILTRATDYDTADDMQAGDEIAVIAGDTLAGSKWMMTQTAAITVGTTDITWLNITDSQNVVTLTGAQTITGSKTFDAEQFFSGKITHAGDADNFIEFGTDTQDFQTGGASRMDLSDLGLRLGGANARLDSFLDEDDMISDSATAGATQQSIKAYVDAQVGPGANPTFETVTFSPTTGGIVGTTTNDSAGAGFVGQYVSSIIPVGSAVSLTTGTTANVTSISLTAGDWDVGGEVTIGGTATSAGLSRAAVTSTSATYPSARADNNAESGSRATGAFGANGSELLTTGLARLSLSSTTTVYLVASCTFSGGTCTAFGKIRARRVR